MTVPVTNPTDTAILIPVNGRAWLFPPMASKAFWKVVENAKAKIGEDPYQIVQLTPGDKEIGGCIRGPIVHVPNHVAHELKTNGYCHARNSHLLKIGAEVLRTESENFEAVRAQREAAEAELAKLRAEIEAQRAALPKSKL